MHFPLLQAFDLKKDAVENEAIYWAKKGCRMPGKIGEVDYDHYDEQQQEDPSVRRLPTRPAAMCGETAREALYRLWTVYGGAKQTIVEIHTTILRFSDVTTTNSVYFDIPQELQKEMEVVKGKKRYSDRPYLDDEDWEVDAEFEGEGECLMRDDEGLVE